MSCRLSCEYCGLGLFLFAANGSLWLSLYSTFIRPRFFARHFVLSGPLFYPDIVTGQAQLYFTLLICLVTVAGFHHLIIGLLMLIKLVRNALGNVIVFVDWLTRPKVTQRSPADQSRVQSAMNGLSLYQFRACPFCVKTRRAIHNLGVDIELRDINKDVKHREALEQGAGRVKVPCLRIEDNNEVRWMYESNDIIAYLNQRVSG